ncbi:hypothetical protein BCR34DRAFT_22649 [Clohesyomyces aquaticus]|uniref:Uncharacterized protein n=1 Tax=Clohesyomyces aquaticus TaxID=1231657 RepID=A0A1Y2A5N9_9PLEO|nr:hypothetical protein BCR34DRAFT_22649 [Clohesyomyces aquaticus]
MLNRTTEPLRKSGPGCMDRCRIPAYRRTNGGWLCIPLDVARLKNLRRLHLWFGLDSTSGTFNERAILSYFQSLSKSPDLTISFGFPNVDPHIQDLGRHFTENSPAPPFPIHRRPENVWHPSDLAKYFRRSSEDFSNNVSGEAN